MDINRVVKAGGRAGTGRRRGWGVKRGTFEILSKIKIKNEFSLKDLPFGIIEVHGFFGFVVGSHSEWNDFHRGEARGHAQDLASVSGFIQVFLGLGVGHSCRVPAHNVEVGPRNHPGPAVPLDLGNIM